jgi:Xaa-Pro dipeptidase
MTDTSPRPGPLPWKELRHRLDDSRAFNAMRGTPYYRDAVYEQFSAAEYARRHDAFRAKLRELELDCAIVPGGPSHWSFGGGALWLSGHWEWHALAAYLVVPLEGEPTLVYAMGGTHAEAVRREVAVALSDVRPSRNGRYAEVIVERLRELGLERGRIGLLEIDGRHEDYLPVNQYEVLRRSLPEAELVFTKGILHELMSVKSEEEIERFRVSGQLCRAAMDAIVERAAPGVSEEDLRAAAGAAILEGGGDIDFLIIGSTPMSDPALVFGNPRPSRRVLAEGDLILMELAAGYRGYAAQIGSPVCVGEPPPEVRRFWEEVAKPGYELMVEAIGPGKPVDGLREAGRFFRERGAQSRPIHAHGIDLVSSAPHVYVERTVAEPFEEVFRPGNVIMAEPNPITADGTLGMFVGHTFVVTEGGRECLDDFPVELVVTGSRGGRA